MNVFPLWVGELEISQCGEGGIMYSQGGNDWHISQ